MATNRFVTPFGYSQEQRLSEDLIIESIKMYGVDIMYLPRTVVDDDPLFGEDPTSRFELAVPLEMYVNNLRSFEGEGDLLAKFSNIEVNDEITLTVARRRWEQIRREKMIAEENDNYALESTDTLLYGQYDGYLLEQGNANGYSISSSRPMEGDLLYIPFINNGNGAIYEIKFVEHESIFYQFGRLYTYELRCELFRYSSEQMRTGNTVIDSIETNLSLDILSHQFLLENGSALLNEDGGSLLVEFRIEDVTPTANNELFEKAKGLYIDFSEDNPFSEDDRV